ncbi:hypothetical protein T265_01548 [Opisthorchis viverrini]|uniref:Uncharacterized protein n=1 Tax=Opisthorchis viverrini TaxID=6198 RepID=A0A075AIW0_OPIVI|nr:hypothetical protein T265_01548 [Opisthorchis viverrini]KER32319.1 hypothetical protein T265_01548 [Opisthorchis viverrini]
MHRRKSIIISQGDSCAPVRSGLRINVSGGMERKNDNFRKSTNYLPTTSKKPWNSSVRVDQTVMSGQREDRRLPLYANTMVHAKSKGYRVGCMSSIGKQDTASVAIPSVSQDSKISGEVGDGAMLIHNSLRKGIHLHASNDLESREEDSVMMEENSKSKTQFQDTTKLYAGKKLSHDADSYHSELETIVAKVCMWYLKVRTNINKLYGNASSTQGTENLYNVISSYLDQLQTLLGTNLPDITNPNSAESRSPATSRKHSGTILEGDRPLPVAQQAYHNTNATMRVENHPVGMLATTTFCEEPQQEERIPTPYVNQYFSEAASGDIEAEQPIASPSRTVASDMINTEKSVSPKVSLQVSLRTKGLPVESWCDGGTDQNSNCNILYNENVGKLSSMLRFLNQPYRMDDADTMCKDVQGSQVHCSTGYNNLFHCSEKQGCVTNWQNCSPNTFSTRQLISRLIYGTVYTKSYTLLSWLYPAGEVVQIWAESMHQTRLVLHSREHTLVVVTGFKAHIELSSVVERVMSRSSLHSVHETEEEEDDPVFLVEAILLRAPEEETKKRVGLGKKIAVTDEKDDSAASSPLPEPPEELPTWSEPNLPPPPWLEEPSVSHQIKVYPTECLQLPIRSVTKPNAPYLLWKCASVDPVVQHSFENFDWNLFHQDWS